MKATLISLLLGVLVPTTPPSTCDINGICKKALQAPNVNIAGPATYRRSDGKQAVDFTYGTYSLPPNAAATGKACAVDATKFGLKASWTSATSTQYTGCVVDGTWDFSAVTNFALDVGFDLSYTSTSVWVLMSSDATLSAYANYSNSASMWVNAPKLHRGWIYWTRAGMTNKAGGTTNWSAIKHIEIRFIRSNTNTADAGNMWLYGLWTDPAMKAKVILSHDDGLSSYYNNGYPYEKANNITETLYINGGFIGTNNYMTVAQLKELRDLGWDIGSHTWDHGLLSLSPISSYTRSGTTATLVTSWAHGYSNGNQITIAGCDESEYNGVRTVTATNSTTLTFTTAGTNADTTAKGWCYIQAAKDVNMVNAEIRRNIEWLQANGFYHANLHFAYPYGAWDPGVVSILQSYGVVTARTITSTTAGSNPYFPVFNGFPTGPTTSFPLLMTLPGYTMDSSSTSHTPANILGQVDAAIAAGATIILYGHGINANGGNPSLCTANGSPWACCTAAGVGATCASATEQWVNDFRAVIDGLVTRRAAGQIDIVTMNDWYNHL